MSSLSAVLPHLEQRFESQRLVFWHDAEGEYASDLDALNLAGITTLRVENNEYAVKNPSATTKPTSTIRPRRRSPAIHSISAASTSPPSR